MVSKYGMGATVKAERWNGRHAMPGLTKEAELMNGRMAMLGLTALISTPIATGKPILDIVDQGIGGLLLTNPMF